VKHEKVIERVYNPGRLRMAWQQVRKNAGAAGIDEMTVEEFGRREDEILALIHEKLKAGAYRFKPARRVLIPKEGTVKTIENVTPTTVIIDPAIVDNIPRAPSAPTPNRRGQRDSHCSLPMKSASIKAVARAMLTATIIAGTNQKLARRLLQSRLSLFMIEPPM
jgi:hypothetical protein